VSCLWDSIASSGPNADGVLHGRGASVALSELATGSTFGRALEALRGRSVLIATREQLPAALALIELDGIARRMVLCTSDLTPAQLGTVAAAAQADAIVLDAPSPAIAPAGLARYTGGARPVAGHVTRRASAATEWILLTSGTTGVPKLVVHTLQSLGGALTTLPAAVLRDPGTKAIWSTFYDIRRYGGLQIFLRAVLSGSPLVLSSREEPTRDFLARAAAAGVTHISGTPSHWRRALMSGEAARLKPEYVRLSGEVADQAVLDSLRAVYPHARIAHAFASTEAGVAFDVNDGLAGFPASLVDNPGGEIDLRIVDQTLRIRSSRTAARYLGAAPELLVNEEGYVDTGDMVELVDGRYHFRGRMGGVINVGGLKVYPEEVESILNADPRVRMSLVRARRNPITGAVVVADVVLANPGDIDMPGIADAVRSELLAACRRALPAHKVPAVLRFVPALEFTPAGKLVRPNT
jgi:acyl-coenzyme A synthetase/AMP-(fatty) acid ligase